MPTIREQLDTIRVSRDGKFIEEFNKKFGLKPLRSLPSGLEIDESPDIPTVENQFSSIIWKPKGKEFIEEFNKKFGLKPLRSLPSDPVDFKEDESSSDQEIGTKDNNTSDDGIGFFSRRGAQKVEETSLEIVRDLK